jgi:hypothetical protein
MKRLAQCPTDYVHSQLKYHTQCHSHPNSTLENYAGLQSPSIVKVLVVASLLSTTAFACRPKVTWVARSSHCCFVSLSPKLVQSLLV